MRGDYLSLTLMLLGSVAHCQSFEGPSFSKRIHLHVWTAIDDIGSTTVPTFNSDETSNENAENHNEVQERDDGKSYQKVGSMEWDRQPVMRNGDDVTFRAVLHTNPSKLEEERATIVSGIHPTNRLFPYAGC